MPCEQVFTPKDIAWYGVVQFCRFTGKLALSNPGLEKLDTSQGILIRLLVYSGVSMKTLPFMAHPIMIYKHYLPDWGI